jgi:23S rRNA pseudouridine1911/1915/1917 synthase
VSDDVFWVSAQTAGQRLDAFLRGVTSGVSRAALTELISQGHVKVNGRRASKGQLLAAGDEVQLDAAARVQGAARDPSLVLDVLHEDAWLVAVNKPAGVPSHALRAGETGNVGSALLARYPEMREVGHRALEPGLLHRLDTDTSGVLLAARSREAFDALHALHVRGGIDKQYVALCAGQVTAPQDVRAYLDASTRKVRVSQVPWGQARAVQLRVLDTKALAGHSLVTVSAAFAARHQVRAQLAALGHPIAGDVLYGGPALAGLSRHFLHASRVQLEHPDTGKTLVIEAPLAADLAAVVLALG